MRRTAVLVRVGATVLLLAAASAPARAQLLLGTGGSFGHGGNAPVVALDYLSSGQRLGWEVGATAWASNHRVDANVDAHAALSLCRGRLCGMLGAAYLARADWLDGARLNFRLGLTWRIGAGPLQGIAVVHDSDAGIHYPNFGRNAALLEWRLLP